MAVHARRIAPLDVRSDLAGSTPENVHAPLILPGTNV